MAPRSNLHEVCASVDFTSLLAFMPTSTYSTVPVLLRVRSARLGALLGLLLVAAACEDNAAMQRVLGREPVVSRWSRDSLLLEDKPEVLFRVLADPGGAYVVPLATVGKDGLRQLKMSARGWRQLDADYMRGGKMLTPHRGGRSESPVRMFRGMWQPGAPALDSLNCPVVIPMGRSIVSTNDGNRMLPPLATTGQRPPLAHSATLDQAGITRAMANVPTLVAPTKGIPPAQLSKYERRIHQVPTGINGGTTLIVEYNDRSPLPDSLKAFGERPRQLIVMLDKATYGYRSTFAFSTVGARTTPPRLEFLDYMDVDNDGVPEIFFGLQERELSPTFTVAYRFENDAWREVFRFTGNRCAF